MMDAAEIRHMITHHGTPKFPGNINSLRALVSSRYPAESADDPRLKEK
jgi:hypothetical protein